MYTSFLRTPPQNARPASLHRISQGLLLAALLLCALPASTDVGLPAYEGPLPDTPQLALESYAVTRQISTQTDLSCSTGSPATGSSLSFALAADFRPTSGLPVQLPLVVRGNQAALHIGMTRHTTSVQFHEGRVFFIGTDDNFFNSLQGLQPDDELFVQTAQTLRQYRITSAQLSQGVASHGIGEEESLSLLACYPFQPASNKPVFYELRARPLIPDLLHQEQEEELINF